jgi:zinc transport system permease protein
MIDFLSALWTYPFLLMALGSGLLASIVGGIMGSYVITKRISFISGSISHSLLAGVGVSVYLLRAHNILWFDPLQGALFAAIISALFIGIVHQYSKEREDAVIAAIWSIGMAVGILFLAKTPGFSVELSNFLIGNLLWTTRQDLLLLVLLDAVVIISCILLHSKLLALSFDEEQAALQGVRVKFLNLFLLILVAITVVVLMQVVGIILTMTMLTLPATIASLFSRKLVQMMFLGVIVSAIACIFGLAIAFSYDLPCGATIAAVTGGGYIIALLARPKARIG